MADKKLSALTELAVTPDDADELYINDGGGSKKITYGTLKAGLDTATTTHAATEKTTPVDADEVPLADSAASFALKRLTWANIKTTLSGVFAVLAGKAGGQTLIGGTADTDKLVLQGTSGTPTGGQVLVPTGSVVAGNGPGLAFTGIIATGFSANNENICLWESGAIALNLSNALKEFRVPSDYKYSFCSVTNNNAGSDTSFYRYAAGVLATTSQFAVYKTTEQLRLGYDASNYASFTVDSAGNLTLANTGTTPSTYIATLRSGMKVTSVTTTASPASTDAGTTFTNEGDADGATITLPTATAGLNFIAYVQTAQTLTITAGSGDTIRIASSVTAAAGSITSNVVGSSVTLVAINATEWVATSSIGSWSF